MRKIEQRGHSPKALAMAAQPSASPWRGVVLLMATVSATELMMLNIIFLAGAQASLAGLALAVIWPWAAALAGVTLWSTKERWMPALAQRDLPVHLPVQPKASLGIAAALAAIVLIGRLVVAA